MQSFNTITKKNLHHAYLVEGGESVLNDVLGVAEQLLSAPVAGNPDVYIERYESFGVDEARLVREKIFLKPFGTLALTIVFAQQVTGEAQNALLKVLEEPPATSTFFLITPSAGRMLPTLRSRMQEIQVDSGQLTVDSNAQEFLKASPARRLEMVKKIIEDKDRAQARVLTHDLMSVIHQKFIAGEQKYAPALEELRRMSDFLGDTAASPKLILEHMALVLPRL